MKTTKFIWRIYLCTALATLGCTSNAAQQKSEQAAALDSDSVVAAAVDGTTAIEETYLSYIGDFHKDIIAPQVEAWKEVAKGMYPRVCDDMVTQEAATFMDSLADVLLANPQLPHGEQQARICEIEAMAVYGMSYLTALFGLYRDPETARRLQLSLDKSCWYLDTLKSSEHKNARILADYEYDVYFYNLYFLILATDYQDDEPRFVRHNINMCISRCDALDSLFDNLPDKIQAYRYATPLLNTLHFMTYNTLAHLFCGDDFYHTIEAEYYESGGWYDETADPILETAFNKKIDTLPEFTLEDFSAFLKKSATYRAQIIHLLARAINAMPVNEQPQSE